VKQYTGSRLDDREFVLKVIKDATSTAWVSGVGWDGMGDRVSRGVSRVHLDAMESILDVQKLLVRVDEIEKGALSETERALVLRFREGIANVEAEDKSRKASHVVSGEGLPDGSNKSENNKEERF
jgi:hypothetical protein